MQKIIKNQNNRNGITLLFVVSIIVLFLLMGTTFVVVSNDYLSAARKRGQFRLTGDRGALLVKRALFDFIRGPDLRNATSPLRGHSLLADQYGYGYTGFVASMTEVPDSNRQLFDLRLQDKDDTLDSLNPILDDGSIGTVTLSNITNDVDHYFSGQVLSFVSGPAKGTSVRIFGYGLDGTQHIFRIYAEGANGVMLNDVVGTLTTNPSKVVLNGRPFSGFGAGYNNEFDPNVGGNPITEAARRPNYKSLEDFGDIDPTLENFADAFFSRYVTIENAVNEPYDAFNHDNVFLGGFGDFNGDGANDPVDGSSEELISFHRPGLANSGVPENLYSFRPVWVDEDGDGNADYEGMTAGPNFPGIYYDHDLDGGAVTPEIANFQRPLDVDNDGDGELDSVWIDIGLPIQSNGEGNIVKPLVAVSIQDLDSRFNLNAHGNLVEFQNDQLMTRLNLLGGANAVGPRGQGLGPAEVSLRSLIGSGDDYSALLTGNGTYEGRYGADQQPGAAGRDEWSYVKFVGYPDASYLTGPNDPNSNFVGGLFTSSNLDVFGRYIQGAPDYSDANGVPFGTMVSDVDTSTRTTGDLIDSPYEVNLLSSRYNEDDSLFSAHELEAIMRPNDRDSLALPQRLVSLLGPDAAAARNVVTTASFEVPRMPQILQTIESPVGSGQFRYRWTGVADALYSLLNANLTARFPGDSPQQIVDRTRVQISLLVAPEVIRGLPMNINRKFGDGQDNDGDGVYDEHWHDTQASLNEAVRDAIRYDEVTGTGMPTSPVAMDHDNDGTANGNSDNLARHIFARQLFVLAQMATGQWNGGTFTVADFNGDGANSELDVHALAQWCVNVVDFRDPDVINTPFEYDVNPFDGWDVDGYISTNEGPERFVVWGAERPELLISEALATHDRKSENLVNGGLWSAGGNPPDSDFDSHSLPSASCFVELYAPHSSTPNTETLPAELYQNGGINLAQSASTTEVVPVWRLLFTEAPGDLPDGAKSRRVYFIKPSDTVSAGQPVEDGVNENFYFPDSTISPASVEHLVYPNSYAVIGSGGVEYNNGVTRVYRTTFGRRTDATVDHVGDHMGTDLDIENTRQIRLIPDASDSANSQVVVQTGDFATSEIRNVVAIPINRSGHVSHMFPLVDVDGDAERSFGLSDPENGYYEAFPGSTIRKIMPSAGGVRAGDGLYFAGEVRQEPVDKEIGHEPKLFADGIYGDFRYVALQRLANPQAPYDELLNPYVSVDEMPVDLTVFNGCDSYPGEYEPSLEMLAIENPADVFRTVERGGTDDFSDGTEPVERLRLLWRSDWTSEPVSSDDINPVVADHFFNWDMRETWGQMSEDYRDSGRFTSTAWPAFTWNNRPFVSQYELSLVPGGSGMRYVNPYNQAPGGPIQDLNDPTTWVKRPNDPIRELPHSTAEILQNFALSGSTYNGADVGHLMPFSDPDNNLYRLFEFLEVPSRFIGTDIDFNPNDFQAGNVAGVNAPFNTVSRYRNPGKINVNTILNGEVWNALMGGEEFGYAGEAGAPGTPAGTDGIPYSEMAAIRDGNPFRPVDFGRFAPAGVTRFSADNEQIACTFQRQINPGERVFQYENTNPHIDTRRNQAFADGPMSRIANIATTRSSVFAIWITVGYFEVDENGLLGAEVGANESAAQRNRGFFIFDRSIPVAFEPGNNHNVENGILTQSIFE